MSKYTITINPARFYVQRVESEIDPSLCCYEVVAKGDGQARVFCSDKEADSQRIAATLNRNIHDHPYVAY